MKTRLLNWLMGLLFVAGLLLAGAECDPPWWPWINLAGCCVFGLFCLLANYLRPAPWRE